MKVNQRQLKSKMKRILGRNGSDRGMLVSILQDTQAEFGYLSREAITEISKQLDVPLSQVYGVATFFKAFSLTPRGRHQVQVCLGTACHVRGAEKILDTVKRELGIKPGENDKGLNFSLETVNCVGACALGPIVIVDGKYSGEMKIEAVKPLLDGYK
ncbi:MAG TPA: NAD(P)H-dependent oxidoreductase subunit E [Dehalococcoidales bacterium]